MHKWAALGRIVNLEDQKEISDLLDIWDHELEYVDNVRIAQVSNLVDTYQYEVAKAKGCCGRRDIVYECNTGTKYLVGCNYGH